MDLHRRVIVMKIIKNNFKENKKDNEENVNAKIIEVKCEHCASELEVTEEDTHIGAYGAVYVTCPCCGEDTIVLDLPGIVLTRDNIKFQNHFDKFGRSGKLSEISSEIEKNIQMGIDILRRDSKSAYYFFSSGSSLVIILKMDGDEEYLIFAANEWHETSISFEKIDQKQVV